MYFSRVIFGGASLFGLLLLFALGTSGRDQDQKYRSVLCQATPVDVDITVGVNPIDIYVCPGDTVTWNAHGHKFTVFFKNKKCPFTNGCRGINDQHPTSSAVLPMKVLTVFDYGIVVDGDVFDPHVVGGGGN